MIESHPFKLSNLHQRLRQRKQQSIFVAKMYYELGKTIKCERMLNCSNEFYISKVEEESGLKFYSVNSWSQCKQRHCPMCQLLKSFKLRALLKKSILIESNYLLLTLTIKNCELSELRKTTELMSEGWSKFWKSAKNDCFIGYLRSLEISVDQEGKGHPHYHILLQTEENYFKEKYKPNTWFSDRWKYSLNLDYTPITWISKVKGNGLMECTKYITKPSAYCNGKILEILDKELDGIHSYSRGGKMKVKQEDLDKIERGEKFESQERQGKPDFKIEWKTNSWNVKQWQLPE
ncbi:hypothetical protein BCD67_24855 [Oscillatoriales cyanobacterium USR001]|nr:hypothetical protein BCD67_24855 [Oscillatoriales cyanobacterium USR001]